jgi:O-antigen/teichoic acid export membrane protein
MIRISKSFLKSSFIYTVAGSLPVASAILLLPFYSAYLSTSGFGALSIYLAFTLLIQYMTTYSYDISLYIHYHEYKNDPRKLSHFVSSAFLLMLAIGGIVAALLTITGELIFALPVFETKSINFYPYGFLAAATGILQALFKVHSNLLQTREKPEVFFWSNIGSFSFIVALSIGGLYLYPQTLIGPVGGRFVAACIMGLWALRRVFVEFGVHFNYALLRSSFGFNFYTFLYQILQWVINYFDRFLLLLYISLSDIGVYDFGIKCLLLIEFLLNGLHNSFYPRVVSTIMNQQEKRSVPEVNRYYHGFTSIVMIMICFCILTFPWAIETFMSKKEYHASIQYLPYLALVYLFRAMRLFFSVPYGILKYSKPLPGIYVVVSVIKVVGVIAMVKPFGLYGVIASTLVSAAVEIVLLRYVIGQKFLFQFNFYKVVGAPLLLFFMILGLEPFFGQTHGPVLHLFYLFMCGALLVWFYRNEVGQINPLKMIRKD